MHHQGKEKIWDDPAPACYRVGYLTNKYVGLAARYVETVHDLLWHEWSVIFFLGMGKVSTAADISRASGRPKNTVGRAVTKLMDRSLIQRDNSSEDRRFFRLSLTEKGTKLYNDVAPKLHDAEASLYGGLTKDEYKKFLFILNKVIDRQMLNECGDAAGPADGN